MHSRGYECERALARACERSCLRQLQVKCSDPALEGADLLRTGSLSSFECEPPQLRGPKAIAAVRLGVVDELEQDSWRATALQVAALV